MVSLPEIYAEFWVEVSVAASCCRPCWARMAPAVRKNTSLLAFCRTLFTRTVIHTLTLLTHHPLRSCLLPNLSLVKFVWRSCCNWYQNSISKWAKTFHSFSTQKKLSKQKIFLATSWKKYYILYTHTNSSPSWWQEPTGKNNGLLYRFVILRPLFTPNKSISSSPLPKCHQIPSLNWGNLIGIIVPKR